MEVNTIKKANLPVSCPSCQEMLKVTQLKCESCHTEINGLYNLPVLMRLPVEDAEFILQFVKNSGSLKEMAKEMGLSYPTVRNLLDEIIKKINHYEN